MAAVSSIRVWTDAAFQAAAGELAQELLILAIFGVSYSAWKLMGQRRRSSGRKGDWEASAKPAKVAPAPPRAPVASMAPRSAAGGLGAQGGAVRQRQAAAPAQAGPQAKVLEKQMVEHMARREFTRALHLYRSLERSGRDGGFSEELYATFVQSSVRVGKVDIVEQMIRTMRSHGMTPSLQFWQSTLKIMSSRKYYSACLNMYFQFGRSIPTDKVLFSCLINAALEVGDPQAAASMLSKYEASGLEPKDYVLHFRTYLVLRDVDLAEATFRRLGEQCMTLVLNLLLLLCVNEKQPERAFGLLQEGHALESGRPEEDLIVDVVSYNTVIKGFSQAGMPQRCFECLQKMTTKGIEPDDITLGTLLDACVADNRLDVASTIADMLMGGSRQIDSVMCSLFKGLVRANCLPKAMELYNEMKQRRGLRPDIITFSMLIKALVEQRDIASAMKVVEDMKEHGDQPDDIIMTHLLEGCRHAHDHELGQKLFDDMMKRGVVPSEFTLVSMLKLHGRCGKHREGYEMVRDWEKLHGSKPSVIHYTCLMSGCIRTKSFDDAWAAYELMRDSRVQPDSTTLTILLPGMVAAQRWEAVAELARAATVGGKASIPAEHVSHAMAQMQASGAPAALMEQLRADMRAAGIAMTARRSLVEGGAVSRPPPGL